MSKLENDAAARSKLFITTWRQQCSEKKAQAKGWRQWLEEEMLWSVPEGNFWDDENYSTVWPPGWIAGLV